MEDEEACRALPFGRHSDRFLVGMLPSLSASAGLFAAKYAEISSSCPTSLSIFLRFLDASSANWLSLGSLRFCRNRISEKTRSGTTCKVRRATREYRMQRKGHAHIRVL